MITYEPRNDIVVKLEGKPVGTIHMDGPRNYYYLPTGHKMNDETKYYPTLLACKQDLEGSD